MIEWSKEYIKTQKEQGVSNIDFLQKSLLSDKHKAYRSFTIISENKKSPKDLKQKTIINHSIYEILSYVIISFIYN